MLTTWESQQYNPRASSLQSYMTSEALRLEKNGRVTEAVKFWKGHMTFSRRHHSRDHLFHLLFSPRIFISRLSFLSLNHYLFHPNSQRKEIKTVTKWRTQTKLLKNTSPILKRESSLPLKAVVGIRKIRIQSAANIQDRPSTQKAFPRRRPPPHSSAPVPAVRSQWGQKSTRDTLTLQGS